MAGPYCQAELRWFQHRPQPRRHLVHLRKRKGRTHLVGQRHMQARNAQAIQQNRLLKGVETSALAVRIEEHSRSYVDRIQAVDTRKIVVLAKDTMKRHRLVKRHRVPSSHMRDKGRGPQPTRTRGNMLCQRVLGRTKGVDKRILKHHSAVYIY